jgi:hypothetical protein
VGVARYFVYRSSTAGFTPAAGNQIATVTSGTSYVDQPLAVGTYYYRVIAEDAAGNDSASSAEVSGQSLGDTVAPAVSLTAPSAGSTVKSIVTVSANASDAVGVVGVQFKLDGANLGSEDTSSPYSVSWDTTTATAGTHVLTAVARDAAGNSGTATNVSVTVDNSVPAGPQPVAAYSFDDGSGSSLIDRTGKGHTGAVREAVWAAGKNGGALQFDGVNDWVTVDDAPDLQLVGTMTVEAWVNPSATTNWRTVLMKEKPGDMAYSLYAAGDGRFPTAQVGSASTRATPILTTNTWTHLAATYDGTTLRIYVNGVQKATKAVSGGLTASSGVLRIGGNGNWLDEFFAGKIDDVRVYNSTLTAAQITTDMNTPVS